MDPLSDAAVDALILEEERRLRRFKLFHCSDEERRRCYGAVPPPARPPPPRETPEEAALAELDEELAREYRRQCGGDDSATDLRRDGPPPPNYCGPLLTLTTRGPYTRYEVLATRSPIRPRFVGKKMCDEKRSKHYPRPVKEKPKEEGSGKPGESLRRWKYSMGLMDE